MNLLVYKTVATPLLKNSKTERYQRAVLKERRNKNIVLEEKADTNFTVSNFCI